VKGNRSRLILVLLLASCAHLVPANWREFEGDIPPLRPIVISSLVAHGLTVVPDSTENTKITTQWQYANPDALSRERHRMVVHWKLKTADKSVVLYVQHENQSIESSLEGGVDFQSIYPDQEFQSKILEDITSKILTPKRHAP
jgi:hypothetical protein